MVQVGWSDTRENKGITGAEANANNDVGCLVTICTQWVSVSRNAWALARDVSDSPIYIYEMSARS